MYSLIYAALPMALMMFSSVIRYVLLLLIMVTATLSFVSTYCRSNTLLLLVIMTVYIGAIITLFVYIRAVSPNDYIQSDSQVNNVLLLVSVFVVSLVLIPGISYVSLGPSLVVRVSSEIFSGHGVYLTGFLTLVLLLMLLVSTYSTPSISMFRALK